MFKYFIVFGILVLSFCILKQELLILDKTLDEKTSLKLLGIFLIFIQTVIIVFFVLILLFFIKSFLIWQMKPKIFSNGMYEEIVKKKIITLIIGVFLMIMTVVFFQSDIQKLGTQLSGIKDFKTKMKISSLDTNWKIILRIIWTSTVLIAISMFGFELYNKIKIKAEVAFLVSVLMFIILIIPYLQEIYQSFKNI